MAAIAAILNFRSERCKLFLIYKSPSKFQVNWPFGSGDGKIPFQDSCHGVHLGFSIGTILAFFLINKSPRCFLPSFKSIGLSVQEKKRKIRFQDGCHSVHFGFPTGTLEAMFDLQVTPMLLPSLGSGEAKNRFSRWRPWRPFRFSHRKNFSYY